MSTEPEENYDEEDYNEKFELESSVELFSDSVSYFVYDKDDEDQWIRSTITIEQREGEDGFEELESRDWTQEDDES